MLVNDLLKAVISQKEGEKVDITTLIKQPLIFPETVKRIVALNNLKKP
ncbi:hypothetical protein PT276_06855 [Orbaceae bacterium ESL0721]|nr:hypothetical protein [Orbaceae bacterium ESL0721]